MGKFALRNIPNDLAPANLAKMSHIRKKLVYCFQNSHSGLHDSILIIYRYMTIRIIFKTFYCPFIF